MVDRMTESEIIKELNKIGDIRMVTNPWLNAHYWDLMEEYLSRTFMRDVFNDEYNHKNEKELLKDIDAKKVFENLGQ